ncbi:hypothetical protein FIU97_12210 [Roseivivax sp. THAF40]|uniref:hypothetical protein n=1 Tax=unclassified Roseivivax TaxID=2639302 RepID=UPI00126905C0|nr:MULTISPECIES: hypothetical protein [unclassified Roseivivax]QFS83596.1 hypothetical protein FIV09_12225 [Roseivivax sp. THAF197b]QFT47342.1 hypothetical protein FIU97_12210 [Roseivivax sp. THAF40]
MTDFTPGDVVEIHTGKGLAYAQITHNHGSYPSVVRALGGLFDTRPSDLAALVAGDSLFVAMIPLGSAMERVGRSCAVVANIEVPDAQKAFPTFRMPIRDKKGEIVYWWFWDGRGLSYDVELDAQQESLPMREVMTGARFIERLETQAA